MNKIIIIGGDGRFKNLQAELEKKQYRVSTLGLYENDSGNISDADTVILPVPATRDKINVFTPLTKRQIPLSLINAEASADSLILTCGCSFANRECIDYGNTDGYALRNAVPTAEGALKVAIENTSRTLFGSSALVIGFGRVGKITADRFKSVGCDVTVAARREADLGLGRALGYKCVNTAELDSIPLDYDIIINTVDARVLSDETLNKLHAELLLELSTHGGFNFESARRLGLNAIKAPGLPMLTAPQTACEILTETVINIIDNRNKR